MRDARNACLEQSSGEGRGGSGLRGGVGCLTLFGRLCNVVFGSAVLMSAGTRVMVHARISGDESLSDSGVSVMAMTM